MSTVTLTAPDISCDHCKGTIESRLPQVEGVRRAVVDVAPKTVTVDFDESVTGVDELRAALDDLGYPANP